MRGPVFRIHGSTFAAIGEAEQTGSGPLVTEEIASQNTYKIPKRYLRAIILNRESLSRIGDVERTACTGRCIVQTQSPREAPIWIGDECSRKSLTATACVRVQLTRKSPKFSWLAKDGNVTNALAILIRRANPIMIRLKQPTSLKNTITSTKQTLVLGAARVT